MTDNTCLNKLRQLDEHPNLVTNQPSNQLLNLVENNLVNQSNVKNDIYKFNLTKDGYVTLNRLEEKARIKNHFENKDSKMRMRWFSIDCGLFMLPLIYVLVSTICNYNLPQRFKGLLVAFIIVLVTFIFIINPNLANYMSKRNYQELVKKLAEVK